MKKSKAWIAIPLYWIAFVVYSMFLDSIWINFPTSDFIEGSDEYHYGPCSFSITVSFILMLLAVYYVYVIRRKTKLYGNRGKIGIMVVGLIWSFIIQVYFLLYYFSLI